MEQNTTAEPQHHAPETPPAGRQRRAKQWLISGIMLVVLIAACGLFWALGKKDTPNSSPPTTSVRQMSFAKQYADVCDAKASFNGFTRSLIPQAQLGYIEPMGKVMDGHVTPTDHLYVAPKSRDAADNTTDVVMPADGRIVEIAAMPAEYIGDRAGQTVAPEDHRITIAFGCKQFSILIHVHRLARPLAEQVGAMKPNTQQRVSIDLKAGDKIGTIGGNPVDWTFVDTTKTLSGFIHPELYDRESWKIHSVDPLAQYSGDLKTAMQAASLRTSEPFGGKIDYDKKGTLIGNWFQADTNGYAGANQARYWDGHLSIAPDYIDGKTAIVSIGNWDGSAKQYTPREAFNPSSITTADGTVKVELAPITRLTATNQVWNGNDRSIKGGRVAPDLTVPAVGTILFQVEPGEKLKVEVFVGKTAAQVAGFTPAAKTYAR